MKHMKLMTFAALVVAASSAQAGVKTGETAPDFTLTDLSGTEHSLSDFEGKFVVLEWLNFNCPFVERHYASGNLPAMQEKFTDKGVVWLAVNSTAESHRDYESPQELKKTAEKYDAEMTAILMDASGKVGKQYDARTTPHMYIVNPAGKLIYQGAIDDDRRGTKENPTNFVAQALASAMQDSEVAMDTTKPYGCSVKYARN